jgi:hypothetical protein
MSTMMARHGAPAQDADPTPPFETLTLDAVSQWTCAAPARPAARADWFDAEAHLRARRQTRAERDATLLRILRILEDDTLAVSGAHRLEAWRRGWGEILERADAGSLDYETLSPQYFKFDVVRIDDDFMVSETRLFEFALCHAVKATLYDRWLRDGGRIVDLGTGTGANLMLLARMFPESEIVGSDWAEPAVELANRIGGMFDGRVRGARFDMLTLEGREGLGALRGATVLSVHAFEQLGANWSAVLEMLLAEKPALCVQIEPIAEFYETEDRRDGLLAALGLRYHRKRGYLDGYLTALRRLASEGRVEILDARRAPLGTMVHEPYGVLVWRPV